MRRFLFTTLLLLIPATSQAETVERIAAIAGDDIITLNDVRREGALRYTVKGKELKDIDDSANHDEDMEKLVKELVQIRLISKQARKNNISIGDREVDAQIKQMYHSAGMGEDAFRAAMEEEGIKWEDYRAYLRNEIEAQYVMRSEIAGQVMPSEADVIACAQEILPEDDKSITVTLRQIMIPEISADSAAGLNSDSAKKLNEVWWNSLDNAQKIYAQGIQQIATNHPDKFIDYVKRYSSGRSAEREGLLGSFALGDLSKEFAPVFTLNAGDIAPLIETSSGYHIIKVDEVEVTEGESEKWKKTQELCREQIAMKEMQYLIDSWLSDLMEKNYVSITVNNNIRKQE